MKNKKIIFASFSKFSGHYKAAQAIEKAYNYLNGSVQTKQIDSFSYLNPFISTMISNFYDGLVSNLPIIWGYLYDNKTVVKASKYCQDFYFNLAKKAGGILTEQTPDAVICTQAFTCGLFAYYKRRVNQGKVFAVITDHYINSFWINKSVDGYFVPSKELENILVEKGVDQDKIFNVGLPVDPVFIFKKDKNIIKKKLNILQNVPVILIMGGNKGIGQMESVIKKFIETKFNGYIIVVCGKNQDLFKKLKNIKSRMNLKRLLFFETINNIDELMEIADVLVSKPGGITVAEAFSKDLPVISIGAIFGQETHNQEFLLRKGALIVAQNITQVVSIAENIINSHGDFRMLKENIFANNRSDSAMKIASIISDRI